MPGLLIGDLSSTSVALRLLAIVPLILFGMLFMEASIIDKANLLEAKDPATLTGNEYLSSLKRVACGACSGLSVFMGIAATSSVDPDPGGTMESHHEMLPRTCEQCVPQGTGPPFRSRFSTGLWLMPSRQLSSTCQAMIQQQAAVTTDSATRQCVYSTFWDVIECPAADLAGEAKFGLGA